MLFGAEVHFYENNNDYLLYGDSLDFLLKHPNMMQYGIRRFSEFVHNEKDLLLIQAHPFRDGMTIINPELLDGIEIYNAHPRHNSRNDLAEMWQKKYNLLYSAGSDAHESGDISSGILTDIKIDDNQTLLHVLRSGEFEIIR